MNSGFTRFASRLTARLVMLVLLPCLAAGSPGDEVKVTILVVTATQDSPIQVVGIKLPDKAGDPPIVKFHNLSNKQIQQFSVMAMVGNPEKADRVEDSGPGHEVVTGKSQNDRIYWPEEQMILPHGYREAHIGVLSSDGLLAWGQSLHSNCLHAALVVAEVDFSDGTSWTPKSMREYQAIWKRSVQPDSTKSCEHSPAVEEALTQWEGAVGYHADLPTGAGPDFVSSFSLVCHLRPVGGELTAACPW
jgi:hypothetical protein